MMRDKEEHVSLISLADTTGLISNQNQSNVWLMKLC